MNTVTVHERQLKAKVEVIQVTSTTSFLNPYQTVKESEPRA